MKHTLLAPQLLSYPYTPTSGTPQAVGLVGWWPLAVSASAGGLDRMRVSHLTLAGTVNAAPLGWQDRTHVDGVLFTNSTSNRYELTSAVLSAYPMTMSAWVRSSTASPGASMWAMTIGRSGTSLEYFALGYNNTTGTWSCSVANAGNQNHATGGPTLAANILYHIVGVFTSATLRTLYVDGRPVGTETTSRTPASLDRTYIGVLSNAGSLVGPFQGTIADVRLYNRALTPAEVWTLYDPLTRADLYRAPRPGRWLVKAPAAGGTMVPPFYKHLQEQLIA